MGKDKNKEKYDIEVRVKFCRIHKEYLDNVVKYKTSKKKIGINQFNLVHLLVLTRNCSECKWDITTSD